MPTARSPACARCGPRKRWSPAPPESRIGPGCVPAGGGRPTVEPRVRRMAQYSNPQLTQYVDDLIRRLARAESQIAALATHAGVTCDDPPAALPADVVAMVRAGNRLGAAARYRELTGASMADTT